jgi:NADPH-dependent 2,4-dienoyl-CoA reductase/sulfur reductase-like enzyme/peroxiredoxin family protein/rhodanese-related sulfurtransferase/TusA-related sulfurtransferase
MNEDAEIILYEQSENISVARCGIPYYIGGEIQNPDALVLETPQSLKEWFNIDVNTNHQVVAVNTGLQTITVLSPNSAEPFTQSYDSLVLATGSNPIKPDFLGNSARVLSLKNLGDMLVLKDFIDQNNPQTAVVAGAGHVALEVAESLHLLGIAVTIAEPPQQHIGGLDYDIACDAYHYLASQGVSVLHNADIKAVNDRATSLQILTDKDELAAELLIVALGSSPATELAQQAGLQLGVNGAISVDQAMQTSAANVYAVGDAIEVVELVTGEKTAVSLAAPAAKQARIAADNISATNSPHYTGTQKSTVLRIIDLTIASTGITETKAQQLGLSYQKSHTFSTSHAGYYPAAVNMQIKLLFSPSTGKVLGAQMVGYEGVDKRCDVIATAIHFGATVDDLAQLDLGYSPPYSAPKDPVNIAGAVAQNVFTQKLKLFHWHDVDALPQDGSVTLLDVRTQLEFDNGAIGGFVNIPLDQLRSRVGELDPAKPIYIICKTGHRAYIASRILSQKGYDCYDLSGGHQLYSSVTSEPTLEARRLASTTANTGDLQTKQSEAPCRGGHWPPASTTATTGDQWSPLQGARAYAPVATGTPDMPASTPQNKENGTVYNVNAEGLQCPGPILLLSDTLQNLQPGDVIQITATDPAFPEDAESFCRRTGNQFGGVASKAGIFTALITKGVPQNAAAQGGQSGQDGQIIQGGNNKNFIVFSGDLDKAIAAFIMANAAAAMGRKVSMFFTFWGLNILRKPQKVAVPKQLISKMFGAMMPRGSKKLGLSRMNMGGLGAKMIRGVMKNSNIFSLEELMQTAQKNGVQFVACSMSMGVMGIKPEELIDGVKQGGATTMLAFAEESDMSLFI